MTTDEVFANIIRQGKILKKQAEILDIEPSSKITIALVQATLYIDGED